MSQNNGHKTFILEITSEDKRVKLSAYEKLTGDAKTVRHHEFRDISDDEINMMCSSVVELLNRTNHQGKINSENLKELEAAGQILYDSLLTGLVKEKLASTDAENLIISIDDRLVQIPWEIMFDGKNFFCHRFNMGRVVSTSQRISEPAVREIKGPLQMLVVADPRSDLDASYREGIQLRDALDQHPEKVEVELRSSMVDAQLVKSMIRDFDLLHYAGHADYDINDPSDSGFLLHNGKLKASDIINMIGPSPLPSMVFSNACKSGHTEMWKVDEHYENEIYGLANAFLLAGVQHYIGTFWDVQDEPSLYFAVDFYKELMSGAMVGEALRRARLSLIERYGEETIIWAGYMLYGDPTVRYTSSSRYQETTTGAKMLDVEEESEKVLNSALRGSEEVVAFSHSRHNLALYSAIVIFAVIIIGAFSIFINQQNTPTVEAPVNISPESTEDKEKRINDLISILIKKYHEDQAGGKSPAVHVNQSGVPTLVFLNLRTYGVNESDNEFIMTRVISSLQMSKRVNVIEREIIDKLLKELRLSSSELANPETSLRIGRILSANLISVGSIARENNDWQISLRFIETETTSIKAALLKSLKLMERKKQLN